MSRTLFKSNDEKTEFPSRGRWFYLFIPTTKFM